MFVDFWVTLPLFTPRNLPPPRIPKYSYEMHLKQIVNQVSLSILIARLEYYRSLGSLVSIGSALRRLAEVEKKDIKDLTVFLLVDGLQSLTYKEGNKDCMYYKAFSAVSTAAVGGHQLQNGKICWMALLTRRWQKWFCSGTEVTRVMGFMQSSNFYRT